MSKELMLGCKSLPTEHEMMVFNTMAKSAVESRMYRGIGDIAGVMMIMLSARELGVPAMQALNGGINIINGKVEISARMMSALIRKSGHHITIQESTETACTLVGKRGDNQDMATVTYSFVEAQKAGLVKSGGGWVKYPKDMLFARAMSRLARQLFSDVIGIGYVEGEIREAETPEIIVEETELDLLQKFLEVFSDNEDKKIALQYLEAVMKHFNWTKMQTMKELMKDENKLLEKFTVWKNKLKQ